MVKIAIITGSTGNLGKAVTKEIVKAGFTVIGTVEPGKTEQSLDQQVTYKVVDLMDARASKLFVQEIKSTYGKINAAICLVGGFDMASILETNHEDLEKMINLNFYTAFNIVQPVIESAIDQEEMVSIILVGAKPVFEPRSSKMIFPYTLSKSMVVKMAETINIDSKNHNATATVVVPSIIDTRQNRDAMPDANFLDWVSPESIAEKITFICGEGGRDLRETVLKIYGNS
jgi:NAD(P)-dependent dehydrogenase (short-subunit alcohol dehydrogenase family)